MRKNGFIIFSCLLAFHSLSDSKIYASEFLRDTFHLGKRKTQSEISPDKKLRDLLNNRAFRDKKKIYNKIEALLNEGAFVDMRVEGGETALHFAAATGNEDLVNLLIRRGAILDFQLRKGSYTPLMLASIFGHSGVAKILVMSGANTKLLDSQGNSAANLACSRKTADTFAMLEAPTYGVGSNYRHPSGFLNNRHKPQHNSASSYTAEELSRCYLEDGMSLQASLDFVSRLKAFKGKDEELQLILDAMHRNVGSTYVIRLLLGRGITGVPSDILHMIASFFAGLHWLEI